MAPLLGSVTSSHFQGWLGMDVDPVHGAICIQAAAVTTPLECILMAIVLFQDVGVNGPFVPLAFWPRPQLASSSCGL